jgi:site-specific recombinase XerD
MTRPGQVRITGPLVPYRAGFAAELAARGYTPLSAANQLRVMAHLSRWLAAEELEAGGLTPERVEEFLHARRRQGYTCWLSERGLAPLLGHLRTVDAVPRPAPPVPSTPVDELLESYRAYLARERGLTSGTIEHYRAVGRLFLGERSAAEGLGLEGLRTDDVTRFCVRECARYSVGQAKNVVAGLRSLLRFLFLEGLIHAELAQAVPGVAGWRGSGLPKGLDPGQVGALLRSCDRRRGMGRRDHAILSVLVRLGLRAGEVAALELSDVDWRRGEVLVSGKGRRDERLPLPVDVGEAMVAYLRRGRPRVSSPKIFLRARAPHGALTSGAVQAVVREACRRAGLAPVGAHRLRHTAATEMLRAGAPLREVAQVLRHRSVATTAIYAKVDRTALRALARPWPRGAA